MSSQLLFIPKKGSSRCSSTSSSVSECVVLWAEGLTAPLSPVWTQGQDCSGAADKVSRDESEQQHSWRLHLIRLCSATGLIFLLLFLFSPCCLISACQCQVFTIAVCSTQSHAFNQTFLPLCRAAGERGHFYSLFFFL